MLKIHLNLLKIQLYILGVLRVVPKQIDKMHSRYLEGEQKLRMDMKQCVEYFNIPRTWIPDVSLSALGS